MIAFIVFSVLLVACWSANWELKPIAAASETSTPKAGLRFNVWIKKTDLQDARIGRRRSAGRFIRPRTSRHRFSLRWIMVLRAGRGLIFCGAGTGPVAFEVFRERVPPLLPEAWNALCIGVRRHSFPSIGCLFFRAKRPEEF